jgi:hypothetical protein
MKLWSTSRSCRGSLPLSGIESLPSSPQPVDKHIKQFRTYLFVVQQFKVSKAIPGTDRADLQSCEMSRISYFLDSRLIHRWLGFEPYTLVALYLQKYLLVPISVWDWVNTRAMVRLEGFGRFNKFNDLIGTRARDFPACRIAPQQSTLTRVVMKAIFTSRTRDATVNAGSPALFVSLNIPKEPIGPLQVEIGSRFL